MNIKLIERASLAMLVSILAGCSVFRSSPQKVEPATIAIAASSEDKTLPFVLTIIEEVNDGDKLYVLASVKANVLWDLRAAVLRLSAFKNGEQAGESYFPLAHLLERPPATDEEAFIHEGEEKKISISVSAKDLTDYQLDLLWGKEAEKYLDLNTPSRTMLSIENVRLEKTEEGCVAGAGKCATHFAVTGTIKNSAADASGNALLGISFAWIPTGGRLDLSTLLPENEERIEVPGLVLGSGKSIPFRIALDREIPERNDGHFEPVVKLLEFHAATDGGSRSD